jgi:hypothetical protein
MSTKSLERKIMRRRVTTYTIVKVEESWQSRIDEFTVPEHESEYPYPFAVLPGYIHVDRRDKTIEDVLEGPTVTAWPPWSYPWFPRFSKERAAIMECITQLENSFDDFEERQINTVKLKRLLDDLRTKATSSPTSFLRMLNMCLDALDNTRSELLTIDQVQKLAFVLKRMNESLDTDQVNELQGILHKSGLKPTPGLEGLANLYTS